MRRNEVYMKETVYILLSKAYNELYGAEYDPTLETHRQLMENTAYLLCEFGAPLNYAFHLYTHGIKSRELRDDIGAKPDNASSLTETAKKIQPAPQFIAAVYKLKRIAELHETYAMEDDYDMFHWIKSVALAHHIAKYVLFTSEATKDRVVEMIHSHDKILDSLTVNKWAAETAWKMIFPDDVLDIRKMTTEELIAESTMQYDIASTARSRAQTCEAQAVSRFLKDNGLNGVVVHKPTGTKGYLRKNYDYRGLLVDFYPLKKNGEESSRKNEECTEWVACRGTLNNLKKLAETYEPADREEET